MEKDHKYEIVYIDGGDEKTVVGRYRGLKTSDDLAYGGQSEVDVEDAERFHWFQVDGTHGFLSVHPDDLVSHQLLD